MRVWSRCLVVVIAACAVSATASAGDLKFTMQAGRVTILARDVPVQQILQEWARVGRVRIVNAEKLTGALVSLQLVNVPEAEALDTLLRSAAGYVAAPRPANVGGASFYDRIVILPTSRAPALAGGTTTLAAVPQQPVPEVVDADDEPADIAPPGMPPLTLPRMPDPNFPASVTSDSDTADRTTTNADGGPEPLNSAPPGMPPLVLPRTPNPQPRGAAPSVPAIMTAPRPGAPPLPQRPPGGTDR
jgi:hypothetical protein